MRHRAAGLGGSSAACLAAASWQARPVPHLGHVILYVTDLAASVRFYRDVVGLDHRFTDAGYAEFGTVERVVPLIFAALYAAVFVRVLL